MNQKFNLSKSKIVRNEVINKLIVLYAIIVLTYQILYLIVPFRQLIEILHIQYLSPLLAGIGFLIFIWDCLVDRIFFKTKYCCFLAIILLIMLINIIFNIKYGIFENIKSVIWQIVQFFVIFPIYNRYPQNVWKKIWDKYFTGIMIIFTITNTISLYQYFSLKSYTVIYDNNIIKQGLWENRLYGLYSSPHFASVFMLILFIISLYNISTCLDKKMKCFNVIVALSCFFYAVASGTRSVIVGIACVSFLLSCLLFYKRIQTSSNVKRFVISFMSAIFIMLGIIGIFYMGGVIIRNITYKIVEIERNADEENIIIKNEDESEIALAETNENENVISLDVENEEVGLDTKNEEKIISLEREDTSSGDISNNRFRIWKDYLFVLTQDTKDLFFGLGTSSYMVYIRENYPNLYIVKHIEEYYPEMFSKNLIYDTHNAYLGAFVMTGIFGGIVLILFLVCGFVQSIKYMTRNIKIEREVYMIFAIVVFILIASFFDSDLFYRCTSTSVLFWGAIGMLLMFIENYSENNL